jgi:hypothetical protein
MAADDGVYPFPIAQSYAVRQLAPVKSTLRGDLKALAAGVVSALILVVVLL